MVKQILLLKEKIFLKNLPKMKDDPTDNPTGNPIIYNFDFYARLGTLYQFLINLLNEDIKEAKLLN